jgi:hypothetical protein
MTTPACPSYAGHRFPAEIISHAVWLYFRFPLSLRHVDELLGLLHFPCWRVDRPRSSFSSAVTTLTSDLDV